MKEPQGLSSLHKERAEQEELDASSSFIPDLCQNNALLLLILLTELLALTFALLNETQSLIDWEYFGLVSLFMHAIVLSCAAIICSSRKLFKHMSDPAIVVYCMTTIISLVILYSVLCAVLLPSSMFVQPFVFVFQNSLIGAILGALLLRYFYLQSQWRKQKQAELHARLEALQARIRPHFLFNSMNTIASLIAIDPDKAEEAVLDLSALFRATLDNTQMLIPINEELKLCRRYLNIEALRLGGRLSVDWQVQKSTSSLKIPPLTLQPLIENAIYHGIQPRTEGGLITIKTSVEKDFIYILISNPFDDDQVSHKGNQIALANIQSRLTALFGPQAILKTSRHDHIFTVTLRMPINNELPNARQQE